MRHCVRPPSARMNGHHKPQRQPAAAGCALSSSIPMTSNTRDVIRCASRGSVRLLHAPRLNAKLRPGVFAAALQPHGHWATSPGGHVTLFAALIDGAAAVPPCPDHSVTESASVGCLSASTPRTHGSFRRSRIRSRCARFDARSSIKPSVLAALGGIDADSPQAHSSTASILPRRHRLHGDEPVSWASLTALGRPGRSLRQGHRSRGKAFGRRSSGRSPPIPRHFGRHACGSHCVVQLHQWWKHEKSTPFHNEVP